MQMQCQNAVNGSETDAEVTATMTSSTVRRSAQEIMQRICDLLGHPGATIWDRYSSQNRNELLRKLQIIFDPDISDGQTANDRQLNSAQCRVPDIKPVSPAVDAIATQIWAQRKYCDGTLLMSPIFVACIPVNDFEVNGMRSTNYFIRPLFRIAKCFDRSGQTKNCCTLFVDESGRVYSNWKDFVRNNHFGSSVVVVAPIDGIFHQDSNGKVRLSSHKEHHRISLHGTTAVLGMVASSIGVAALFTPLFPFVAASAMVTGVACTSMSIGGGIGRLIDRSHHEQSIGFGNRESRGVWLSIGGGVVAMSAGAAMQGVQMAARNGTILSESATAAVTGLSAAAIATNGVVLVNGFYGFVMDDNRSLLDLLQLSSSMFLLTHSIANFQTARSLYTASQRTTFDSIRSALSENQQRMFDKLLGQTVRRTDGQGYADVFRSLRLVDNYKFQDMSEPHGESSSSKVFNASLSSDLASSGLQLIALEMKEKLSAIIGKMSPLSAVQFVWRFYQNNSTLILEQLHINFDDRFIGDVCRIVRFLAQQAGRLMVEFVRVTAETVIYSKLTMLYENRLMQIVARLAVGSMEEAYAMCVNMLSTFAQYVQDMGDFRETVLELLEELSHRVVMRLIAISKCSFGSLLEMMQFHTFMSFDGFFGEVLNVVLQMARENGFQDLSMYVLCMERTDINKVHDRIKQQFEWLKNVSKNAVKCKSCVGYYNISTL